MSDRLALFEQTVRRLSTLDLPAKARADGPDTMHEAAESATPISGKPRSRIFRYLLDRGEDGATDEQMQLDLRISPNTQRPRRQELVEAGCVKDSGRRGKTKSGRNAILWVTTLGPEDLKRESEEPST